MSNENNKLDDFLGEHHTEIAKAGNIVAAAALSLLAGVSIRHGVDPGVVGQAAQYVNNLTRDVAYPAVSGALHDVSGVVVETAKDITESPRQAVSQAVHAVVPPIESMGSDIGQASLRLGRAAIQHPTMQTSLRRAEALNQHAAPVRNRMVGNPYRSGPMGHPKNLWKRVLNAIRMVPEVAATEAVVRNAAEEHAREAVSNATGQVQLATFHHRIALEKIGIQAGLDIEDGICDAPRQKPVVCELDGPNGIAKLAGWAEQYTALPTPDKTSLQVALDDILRSQPGRAFRERNLLPDEPFSLVDMLRVNDASAHPVRSK